MACLLILKSLPNPTHGALPLNHLSQTVIIVDRAQMTVVLNLDSVHGCSCHRNIDVRSCSRREPSFLRLPPDLVLAVFLINPGLHIVRLLEATLDAVRARPIASPIHALLAMRLFATRVGAAYPHPRDHAPAAEAPAALALRVAAPLHVKHHVTAGAVSEGFVGEVFCCSVGGVQPVLDFAAGLAFVLWLVAVEARLEAAVFASEDTAILLAVEWLEELGAAVHADGAYFKLLAVSGWNSCQLKLLGCKQSTQ